MFDPCKQLTNGLPCGKWHNHLLHGSGNSYCNSIKRLMEEMKSTKVEKELLAQKCHELEMELNLMKEEKSNLSAEFEHLQARMGTSGGKGVPVDSGIRYKGLKKENETLKTELETMEAAKDESQAKCENVEAR